MSDFFINPFDGYQLVGVEVPKAGSDYTQVEQAICVALVGAGETVEQFELLRFDPVDPAGQKTLGFKRALINVLWVICTYLNTGASLTELQKIIGPDGPLGRIADRYRVSLPDPWRPLDWIHNSEDQLLFVNDSTGEVRIVVPHCYTDSADVTEVLREVMDNDQRRLKPE